MYNGVGLPTARGSGSSGRVQSNKFLLRPGGATHHHPSASAPNVEPAVRAAMKEEMAEHQRKRALELREAQALEEQRYTEAEAEAGARVVAAAAEKEATVAKEAHASLGFFPGSLPRGTPP